MSPTNKPRSIRIGTRGSALARQQTDYVRALLEAAWPGLAVEVQIIRTKGDRVLDTPLPLVGGKGLFTAELEAALRGRRIDFAVHSLKDLPTDTPSGLAIGAIPRRADPRDVLISRANHTHDTLPSGAVVGTSSRRRAAQMLHNNPALQVVAIRGNVDTRIRKAQDSGGPYDAIILAHAGIARLERLDAVSEILPLDLMLPAPGQGALAVQCRDEPESRNLLEPLNHRETELSVTAERAFLAGLGGGCALPIAARALIDGDTLRLQGRISALDGSAQFDLSASASRPDPLTLPIQTAKSLGKTLAAQLLARGAGQILDTVT